MSVTSPSSSPSDHSGRTETANGLAYCVNSRSLGRTIYSSELPKLDFGDLRTLYHELAADRASMLDSVSIFESRIREGNFVDYAQHKLRQISKKVAVYNVFAKLVRKEVGWRLALNAVGRARFALEAKQVGMTDVQINALLDPDNTVSRIFTAGEYPDSLIERRKISVSERMASLRAALFNNELCRILSQEFEAAELEQIVTEAVQNVDRSVDWDKIESMLEQHMSDGHGIF